MGGDNDNDDGRRAPRPRLISGYLNSINRDNPYNLINSNTWEVYDSSNNNNNNNNNNDNNNN